MNLLESVKKPLKWGLAMGLLTALVTLIMPNHYKSEARLLPVETKGASGNLGGLASAAAAFGVSVPGGEGNDANFVDVLNSRWLRVQLLKTEFQYHARSWRFGAERIEKGTLFAYVDKKNMDRALKELGTLMSASRDLKTKVISISAETKSPELSQLIVDRAIKLLELFQQEKGHTRGGAKATFAEARLAESRREMDVAEDAFRRFLEANRNYLNSADPSVRLKGNRLETELKLRQQLVTTLALNREQALLEEKNDIPILNVLDPANLPIDKSKPLRFVMVILAIILVGTSAWIWLNLEWVRKKLLVDDSKSLDLREKSLE